jgi:dihydrofolate reductase
MKVILVFVSTVDGKVTKWGKPPVNAWTSHEDQQYFTELWKKSNLIVMGSNTFNADPIKTAPNQLLIVLTKHPENYKNNEIPGQVEFTSESPTELVIRFESKGYNQMTVVGGAHVATSFIKDQLIDEIWLTIEPKIFGSGGNLVVDEKMDISLQLLSFEKINPEGTLINKYKVIKKADHQAASIKPAIANKTT